MARRAKDKRKQPHHTAIDDDDCEICRALRDGDDAHALDLIRNDPTNKERYGDWYGGGMTHLTFQENYAAYRRYRVARYGEAR